MTNEFTAAVDWWAAKLQQPPGHQEAGDGLINVVRTIGATQAYTPLAVSQVEAFKILLLTELATIRENHITLSVDYEPKGVLSRALEGALINSDGRLPTKTVMWIEAGRVEVSCGYAAPIEVVFGA